MDLPKFGELKMTQAPSVRLPSTRQIDARIRRQTRTYSIWRAQYLRRKDEGGRTWAGPKPTKPPNVVTTTVHPEGKVLLFLRAPERRHADTIWEVPQVGLHPTHGPLYYLDSKMVMWQQLLRTIPSRRLLVVRGPTPAESLVFKALAQEWVRVPSQRAGKDSRFSVVGYHRWLCYVVRQGQRRGAPLD